MKSPVCVPLESALGTAREDSAFEFWLHGPFPKFRISGRPVDFARGPSEALRKHAQRNQRTGKRFSVLGSRAFSLCRLGKTSTPGTSSASAGILKTK